MVPMGWIQARSLTVNNLGGICLIFKAYISAHYHSFFFVCTSNKCVRAAGRLKAVIQAALPHLGSGTLRPRLPSELDKEYERNISAALLLKTRQACSTRLNPFDDTVRAYMELSQVWQSPCNTLQAVYLQHIAALHASRQ